MKKNLFFTKKTNWHFIAFLVLFCGLFANTISAQALYTWNGAGLDGNWETAANWTTTATGTVPGNNAGDTVVISNGESVLYSTTTLKTVAKLTLSNATGPSAGSTLTINTGASLRVSSGNSLNPIAINGGNLVNNGTLTVASSGSSTSAFNSFLIGNPATAIVGGPFTYGYTGGSGSTLTISLNASAATPSASSTAFQINATTAFSNSKISLVFNGTNTYTANFKTIYAIRTTTTGVAPISIGGTSFSANTSLLSLSNGSDTTVESGTTLTSNVTTNGVYNITVACNASLPSKFTNKGTINILGSSAGFSGIILISPVSSTITFDNQGTLNIDMACTAATRAPFHISNSGALNITNTGTMNLKNTAPNATGNGFAILTTTSGTANVDFMNNGSLNLSGTNFVQGGQVSTKITNNGTLTSNQELINITLLNNSDKTISFVQDAGTLASTNALNTGVTFGTNNGIIQTATGATQLNNLAGVAALSSTSVIEPGGSTGKGIASFSGASFPLLGTLKLQVAGNTAAGTDYDQVNNLAANEGFTINSSAVLDVTGISGTSTPVDIIVANGTGTISGTFLSVIGLTNGWSVDYSTTGKVQLVYSALSPTATTWSGGTSTAWTDGTNWTPNGVPNQNSDVTIVSAANQPTIATNVNINSLTITSGTLTVNTGVNLTVTGAIANSGTMTLASNANLIQGGTTNSNTGNITVNRDSNSLSRLDYTSWSSPVTNASQFLTTFSPVTDLNRFYNYDETLNLYSEIATPAATPFAAGTGYLIRMPNTHPTSPTIWNGSFSGVPNNGTINKAITYNGATFGYNMVGNPYPSTIDAQAFIAANTANIESSLYFWRKINAATGSAYAVYNPMGSTTATPSSALPNGTIQVGQGFFVKAKSASSVNFTNAMRVANNSNQFFKTKATQKDRVWLNLTNTSGVFSQALIGYTADATTGVDMYDAKYINDSPIALTSSINSDEYTIQGRPAFDATDVVMLNFKTNAAGDYTIAIDQADGVFAAGQDVYLVDSKTGTETNLKTSSYTFAVTAGVDNSRFSLKYQKTLSIDTQSFDDNSITVYADNGTLYVNSKSAAINNVTVFDVQGRIIAQKVNVKSTTAVINNLRASSQVLIVKIEGEDNSVVTKKLLN